MATVEQRTMRAIGVYQGLARAGESVAAMMERQLRRAGIGTAQFWILYWLLQDGPTPQATLAESLVLSDTAVSQALNRLAAKSLIARWRKDGYRRRATIHLTPQGRELIGALLPKQAKLIRAQMSALNEREQETLRKLCKKLSDGNPQRYIAELTAEDE